MFATAKNPIFEYERRRMRWVKDIASLTQYARRLWIGSSIAAVVLWLTGTLIAGDDTSFQGNLVLLWVYAALLVMVVVDLYTAFVVAGNLHRQIHSDQWELILISRQPNRSTFRAEYAVAQLRT